MRFLHTSDLHIGKRVNEYSMIEDQRFVLNQIIALTRRYQPDAFLISGDIYDRQTPSTEAVTVFDAFLTELSSVCPNVFIISGNHDSEERLTFAGSILKQSGIYLAPKFDGSIATVTLEDEYGKCDFVMLPFVKPSIVRHCFPDECFDDYNEAMKFLLDKVSTDGRTVLMAHQFVTGAVRSDSEEITSLGGAEEISKDLFARFDYTALGHIHRPQSLSKTIRYSGSPLKYSASEVNYAKSLTLVELKQKGKLEISELPLTPLHDMRTITGTYEGIMDGAKNDAGKNDYIHAILTDRDEIPNAASRIRAAYPNLMSLRYNNQKCAEGPDLLADDISLRATPIEYMCELYFKQNNTKLDGTRLELAKTMIAEVFCTQEGQDS